MSAVTSNQEITSELAKVDWLEIRSNQIFFNQIRVTAELKVVPANLDLWNLRPLPRGPQTRLNQLQFRRVLATKRVAGCFFSTAVSPTYLH